MLPSARRPVCQGVVHRVFAQVIEHESGTAAGHNVVRYLMRVTERASFTSGRRIGEARLYAVQHHGRMHHRGHDASLFFADSLQLTEKALEIGNVIDDQITEHPVEHLVRKRQVRGEVVLQKANYIRPRLGTRTLQHRFRIIDGRHLSARASQSKRIAARAAADVGNRQRANVTEQVLDVRLFQQNKRVLFIVVDLRPAIVAVACGDDIDGTGNGAWDAGHDGIICA
jgi:hypothetical protein